MREPPKESRIMYQEWRELLFLHWKYDRDAIQESLPPGLVVDTFEKDAYITIAPFRIQNFSLANFPSLPVFSDFIEVNVRTYVHDKNGIPGVWFYSLDINSIMASLAARKIFSLPYYDAELKMIKKKEEIQVSGNRREIFRSEMKFTYLPKEKTLKVEPNSLEFFLIERYALFALDSEELYIQRIHHSPYPLLKGALIEYQSHLFEMNSFVQPNNLPDHIHYSPGVNVDFFSQKKILFSK